jgi:hydrogenase expression/formation protein HypD
MSRPAEQWLAELRALEFETPVRIMNVCGGHERAISIAGLRTAIPGNIELVPGPGCPVCICPEEDVFEALNEDIILVAFGDMLRVPVNVPKREPRSLEQARAAGGDIRPIASPLDAVRIANDNPDRKVVFFAAGFETTTAPVAAMLAQGAPDNLLVLLSGRLTRPCVDGDGPRGMGVRRRQAWHPCRGRGFPSGHAVACDGVGAEAARNRHAFPR